MASVAIWLALNHGDKGRLWAALLGAGLFSSIVYLRSIAVPEAGPSYGPIFALALIAASVLRPLFPIPRVWIWGLVLLAAVALAVFWSPVPGPSLDFWLRVTALLGLSLILSLSTNAPRVWRAAAWGIVFIAGFLPIGLAGIKLLSLARLFDVPSALSYLLHLTDLGGANLISRSVLCTVPLMLALTLDHPRRSIRWAGSLSLAGGLFLMLYTRSWGGSFALLVALLVYGAMVYSDRIQATWQWLADSPISKWIVIASSLAMALAFTFIAVRSASLLNVFSFNGRLMHWHGAVLAWMDNLVVGGGPANNALYTPYSESIVDLLVDTGVTLDSPLAVTKVRRTVLNVHAHNLFLEIGAWTGVLGFLAFSGFVGAILLLGLHVWKRSRSASRLAVAGCLAGIAGALAWGLLDVMRVTPPFFSFPVWGLIGLLVAVPGDRHLRDGGWAEEQGQRPSNTRPTCRLNTVGHLTLIVLTILVVLLPALTTNSYAAGFLALQEHRWAEAISHLELANRFDPINPKTRQLLADAYLGHGDMRQATLNYEYASTLRHGYAPYLSQLGWLAWSQGDLDQATDYFQQAVEQDPGEAWGVGLYADLGLAYAAQGRHIEAMQMFKKALELDPQTAAASFWRPTQRENAGFEVLLNTIYLDGPSPDLKKNILFHLGVPDVTERVLALGELAESPISLNDVLDSAYADYEIARAEDNRRAALLLSAIAEASHAAGFRDRAELAYLEFQSLQPNSAFGFRDLGTLYREQGRLDDAQRSLERAVAVSPRNIASRYQLALLYLAQGRWDEAEQALNVITRQALTTMFRSRLFDPEFYTAREFLHEAQGELGQAIAAQQKATTVRDSPADHLALADLLRRTGQSHQAIVACTEAAEALLRTWPRPLSAQLWEIGICVGQSVGNEIPAGLRRLSRKYPVTGNVLLGHIYRARGDLDQALIAYQAAVDARPDEGGPHYFLGETLQALGRLEPAETEYRLAGSLDPHESLPLLALGRMQWAHGQQEAALESFHAAVQTTPGWSQAHVALGNALLALDDPVGAAQYYHRAQVADGDVVEGLVYDFAARLGEAGLEAPSPEYIRNDYFTIDGQERRVLFMHPASTARYIVDVPANSILAFEVATDPESWEQPGDGVTFAVYVESDQDVKQLFSTYIDPKQDAAARRWHPHVVDLEPYAGQTVTIVFETGTGPAGDYRFDWAGWGAPRLLRP
jgi:tetratricopeptide (TPR) repeat protein